MTYARKTLVSLADTPYYHVVARCVRRAWLWGFDEYLGRDYSHRKGWVLERLQRLSGIFVIDICAYAIMSNHYHLVVHVDQKKATSWSLQEVVERWSALFSQPPLVQRWLQGLCDEVEREYAEQIIEQWRRRLADVSWYMRCLNEHLARRANAEDQCKGRFWEGRFRSQALLDEVGLLTAMAYVDLNPVRAGIADTPEASEFTSIYERVRALSEARDVTEGDSATTEVNEAAPVALMPFADEPADSAVRIPYSLRDYLQLVDWTGRTLRADKRGAISVTLPPILQRLNVDEAMWTRIMRPSGNVFGRALGRLGRLRLHAQALGQKRTRGLERARLLYR